MNLKKITPEQREEVAKAVIDSGLNFAKVAKRYGISEMIVMQLFRVHGSKFYHRTDLEKREEEVIEDYLDKQKRFIQRAYDVKVKAVERIEKLLESADDLDDISKMLDTLDKITSKNKEAGDDSGALPTL